MATVYAVASSKGGVGKTTTTVNLGATLASAGVSVAVVDGDLGMANLGDALGIETDRATLHDVLAGTADVEDATYEGPAGLAVVPGDTSIDGFRAADPANLPGVLEALDDYDYVLVDTGAGLSHDTVLPLGLADEVLLVSTTERDSLTDTEKTREVVDRLGGTTRGAVLTCVDPDDPNAAAVAERLGADVIEAIPHDPTVRESMRRSDPLTTYAPESPAASAYRALAAGLTGESIPVPDVGGASTDQAAGPLEANTASEPDAAESTDTEDTGTDDVDSEEATGEEDELEASDDADSEEATGEEDYLEVSDDAEHAEVAESEEGVAADADSATETDDADDTGADDGITLDAPVADDEDEGITLTDAGADEDTGEEATGTGAASATRATIDADESDETEALADADDADAGDADVENDTAVAENADEETDTADDGDADEGDADDGDSSGLTDADALAADTAPSDDPLVADSAEPGAEESTENEADEAPVFTTSLVEEAEPSDDETDGRQTATDTKEDATLVETDDEDDEDDDSGKGFLRRLLG